MRLVPEHPYRSDYRHLPPAIAGEDGAADR
jgi:hypothetical protein